ncbi:hypothetical protein [Paenibacillus planticolens]|uniref:Uncharacterized protein n=1 Tax=Paenibacillus planticolens TaxID=2654976 RepID=A0ABX1ZHX3_9BACL|nr:hypothetical protein [Paenibacillus planticolens]NOU98416.1 hypothetical protein [Paenibacillus planticolens]
MNAISLREAIRIVRPDYAFLRLKPNNSIRNNNTHKLARTIASLYKNVFESVKKDEIRVMNVLGKRLFVPTKLTYEAPSKVAYFIYIEKKRVEFYFIVPRTYLSVVKEKMSDVWTSLTVEEVAELPVFEREATKYQLTYTKEDALSLAVDRRDSDLLYSTLNVIDVLEEGDRVGVFYNFVPSSQFSWRASYRATLDKVRANKPVDRDKTGAGYLVKMAVMLLVNAANSVAEALGSGDKRKDGANLFEEALERMNGGKRVSESTHRKATASLIDTQILVMSRSSDALRQRNNARSLAQSFDTVTEDNALKYRNYGGNFRYTDYKIRGAAVNKTGDEECQSFLALAGRDMLERFNFIDRVETQETEVPDDLQAGIMCIGTNRFRGKDTPAYLSNDREFRNLLTLLIGPTRAGKSNLIANLTVDAIQAGECVIIFDFIENCELSDEVARLFPRDKVLEIRCDDYAKMQGLGYNEVGHTDDVFKAYVNAKDQTSNVLALVNSINAEESRLSPKMERYLESAGLIVFISHGSIKDVFNVLQNHKARADFLSKVPRRQYENLEEYMDSLRELDELDKAGAVIGTKHTLIAGIIDRLNALKRNPYMELMLKKDTSRNINLTEEMQKAQLITIKMPQVMFTTPGEKDVCTTYWITKIWLALQVRADKIRDKSQRTKVNLVIDELYQVENTERFLTANLSQMAKFICKPIVSCHYINQLRYMRDELRSANTSYMLISGCDKKNYDELKSELYPFTAEDMRDLPRYHSINYVKCAQGYARFITKLPGKVERRAIVGETSD